MTMSTGVAHGQKTLQTYSFPIQTHGKECIGDKGVKLQLNQFSILSVCPYTTYYISSDFQGLNTIVNLVTCM